MIGTYTETGKKTAPNPYQVQQVRTASKEKLIAMMFDLGVRFCRNHNREKAAQVLTELIAALNFEYNELALAFFQLYRYALDQVHKNRFDQAATILRELGSTWERHVVPKSG